AVSESERVAVADACAAGLSTLGREGRRLPFCEVNAESKNDESLSSALPAIRLRRGWLFAAELSCFLCRKKRGGADRATEPRHGPARQVDAGARCGGRRRLSAQHRAH